MTLHCYKAAAPFCTLLLLGVASTTVFASTTLEAVSPKNTITSGYIKTETGCYVYRPPLSYGNRVTWTGDCVSGYAQGEGTAKWYNGKQYTSRYQGNFIAGKLQGKGRIYWEIITNCDFDYYEGELKDSEHLGDGMLQFTDGSRYQGQFVAKEKIANGKFTWGRYSGPYRGDNYTGTFVNGKPNGKGVYTWGKYGSWAGDVYKGEYKDGQRHGYGTYTEEDGSYYEGQWQDNTKSGQGKELYSNGLRYEGEFRNNYANGQGNLYWIEGDQYQGQVKQALPHGQGKIFYKNGDIFEGTFVEGKRHGKGKHIFAAGGSYEGDFDKGLQTGEGVSTRANGIRYAGSLIEGNAWGFGHATIPKAAYDDDKRAVNGVWQGDTFVEKGWFYDNRFKFPCNSTADCIQVAKRDVTKQKYLDFLDN